MKFNQMIYYITEGKQGAALHEQDEGVTGLDTRGRKPRSARYATNLQLDPQAARDFKDNHGSAIDKFFKKTPMYLLNFTDANGLPVEPSATIAKTVENLSDEFSTNNNEVETVWFLDKKKSPVIDALRDAIEELSGNTVTNNTKLGHTSRVVRNAILNTDVMTSVEASDTAAPSGEVSKMPGAVADGESENVMYVIAKRLKDVRNELSQLVGSDTLADKLISRLRGELFKTEELTKREIMSILIKKFKEHNIKTITPLDMFDFLKKTKTIEVVKDVEDDQKVDDKKADSDSDEIPLVDLDDTDTGRVGSSDVSRLTGGYGPDARGSSSMADY